MSAAQEEGTRNSHITIIINNTMVFNSCTIDLVSKDFHNSNEIKPMTNEISGCFMNIEINRWHNPVIG